MGLLHLSQELLTDNIEHASATILKALKRAGVTASRDELSLKLRRFSEASPIADGVFAAPGGLGYFMFSPLELDGEEAEEFIRQELNPVPFYHTHCDGNPTRLFLDPLLPRFPELPMPVTVIWTAGIISAVSHGH